MERKKTSNNFFKKLIESLFGSSDADAEKRRQLKLINKRFSKSRYSKFYKRSGNEALPALAKFIYEIYKVIYPAQTMFQAMQNHNILKRLVIEFSIPEEQKKLEEQLSEEKIIEMSKQIPLSNIKAHITKISAQYSDFFTLERITAIDNLYKQMTVFKDFCTYDFYFLLKKFDKTIHEGDFNTPPHFEKVNAEYINENLKDFITIVSTIPFDSDWTSLFKILRAYKGVEPVTLATWKKILSRLQALQVSQAFEMILKMSTENPLLELEIPTVSANIVEPYLDGLRDNAEKTVRKMLEDERNSKANDLITQLFGDIDTQVLKNYTDSLESTFNRKGLKTYVYAHPLNYLKLFLLEVMKRDMREYYDIVVIRGQWESQALTTPFSEGYNQLLAVSEQITAFDASVAEDGATGLKIKTLLPKTERDSGSKNIINRLIDEANETAYAYVIESTKNIVTIGKIIKSLIDDQAKQKPELISNWKELDKYSEIPIKDAGLALYKKIYIFTTLIKTCLSQGNAE